MAQVHASFAALTSPEANKVATLLAGLGAEGDATLAGLPEAAGPIDVTPDGTLEAAPAIDVITDGAKGIDFGARMGGRVQVPDIDVVRGASEASDAVAEDIDAVPENAAMCGIQIDEL